MASEASARPIFPRLSSGPAQDGGRGGRPPPAWPARGRDGRRGLPPRLPGHDPAGAGRPWPASPRRPSTSTSKASRTASSAPSTTSSTRPSRQVGEAFDEPGDLGEKMLAGLTRFMSLAAEEKPAAYLVTVESLTLGAAAVPHRDRAAQRFERMIRGSFEQLPSGHRGLRPDRARDRRRPAHLRLPAHAHRDDRASCPAWPRRSPTGCCATRAPRGGGAARGRRRGADARAGRPLEPGRRTTASRAGTSRPTARAAARRSTSASGSSAPPARVGVEKGYEALSIPAISTAAAVSNQTFYDHFPGKREAFVAAFDALAANTMQVAAGAFAQAASAGDPAGPRRSASACGRCSTTSPRTRSSPGSPSSSCRPPARAALDHADNVLGGFTSYLEAEPGSAPARPCPKVIGEVDRRRHLGDHPARDQHRRARRPAAARAADRRVRRHPARRLR